jgi:hypothetical protein
LNEVLANLHCDIDKESNHIPGKEPETYFCLLYIYIYQLKKKGKAIPVPGHGGP